MTGILAQVKIKGMSPRYDPKDSCEAGDNSGQETAAMTKRQERKT